MLPPNLARALAKGTVMSCFSFFFLSFFFFFLSFFFFFFFFSFLFGGGSWVTGMVTIWADFTKCFSICAKASPEHAMLPWTCVIWLFHWQVSPPLYLGLVERRKTCKGLRTWYWPFCTKETNSSNLEYRLFYRIISFETLQNRHTHCISVGLIFSDT